MKGLRTALPTTFSYMPDWERDWIRMGIGVKIPSGHYYMPVKHGTIGSGLVHVGEDGPPAPFNAEFPQNRGRCECPRDEPERRPRLAKVAPNEYRSIERVSVGEVVIWAQIVLGCCLWAELLYLVVSKVGR
jgi:hypothetical protein